MEKLLKMGVAALMLCGASLANGCVSSQSAYAYDGCAEGTERVRVGPRSQAPKYVCQSKSN